MAVNKPNGDNARIGAIRKRSQTYNDRIGLYVKRDTETGRFIGVKKSGGRFKGVTLEK